MARHGGDIRIDDIPSVETDVIAALARVFAQADRTVPRQVSPSDRTIPRLIARPDRTIHRAPTERADDEVKTVTRSNVFNSAQVFAGLHVILEP